MDPTGASRKRFSSVGDVLWEVVAGVVSSGGFIVGPREGQAVIKTTESASKAPCLSMRWVIMGVLLVIALNMPDASSLRRL